MNIFLCYSSQDKLATRKLYNRLSVYGWLRTWFEFSTHQNVEEVVENSNSVIILLSRQSIFQKGYEEENFVRTINRIKEIKEQSKKRILVLPVRLDECAIPEHLQYLPWKDYFSVTAFEELINSFWIYQYEFTGPAIYAIGGKLASKDPDQFPVQNPAEFYEKIDWHKYTKIPVTSKLNYSFLIQKYHVSNEQYMHFLQSDDYADKGYWINFPKFDENCNYIGDWGDTGLEWLKQVLKHFPSLLEKRLNWEWHLADGAGISYDFRQPNHPAIRITWFEANAYCRWLSVHWGELPESKSILSFMASNKNLIFRLPLETEIHTALTYDDGTRAKEADPTGRQRKDFLGISIDYSERDMLANLYGENLKDSLAYCWGEFFIDKISADNYRISDRGSFGPHVDYEEYAFRVVVAESQKTQ